MEHVMVGTRWVRTDGSHDVTYTVMFVTNLEHQSRTHPPQVIYQGSNGHMWSRPLEAWPPDSLTLLLANCGCKFENNQSNSVILCEACSLLPCHNQRGK